MTVASHHENCGICHAVVCEHTLLDSREPLKSSPTPPLEYQRGAADALAHLEARIRALFPNHQNVYWRQALPVLIRDCRNKFSAPPLPDPMARVTLGSIWRYPQKDVLRRVSSVDPLNTETLDGIPAGDWHNREEEFLARHVFISEGKDSTDEK